MTYVPDYIEWDGSEWCLEEILQRWGDHIKKYPRSGEHVGIECSTFSMWRKYPSGLVPTFRYKDKPTEVELGDRIYFRDYGTGIYHSPNPGIVQLGSPEDHFTINGRGVCFSSSKFKCPPGIWEPWDLTGRPAHMNGIAVKIRGVEAFASGRGPDWPYQHSFAVLLNEEDANKILGVTHDYSSNRSQTGENQDQ